MPVHSRFLSQSLWTDFHLPVENYFQVSVEVLLVVVDARKCPQEHPLTFFSLTDFHDVCTYNICPDCLSLKRGRNRSKSKVGKLFIDFTRLFFKCCQDKPVLKAAADQ